MKVSEHIKNAAGKTLVSFEVIPPLKGQNIQSIYDAVEPLMDFNPPFIDVTYHREEYNYRDVGNGLWEKKSIRKRPGTVGICAAIQNRFKVDAVPHILCGGFNREETENFLIDLNFLDIDNVVALRGDPVKNETYFRPDPEGNHYASDLVKQIRNLNQGIYLDPELRNTCQTDFCVGVAGYPEKHLEAPNFETDLYFLKEKVEAGADYVITQMFFDNKKYFHFVKKCREAGINVPIIPGLKPLASSGQLNLLAQRFKVDLPDDLVGAVRRVKSEKAVREIGIEWCTLQSRELVAAGVPVLHYYSMGKPDNIKKTILQTF